MAEIDRAITTGETEGFLQLVTAKGWQNRVPSLASQVGDEIVGACFVGLNLISDLLYRVLDPRAS